jgi:hypothetical protein
MVKMKYIMIAGVVLIAGILVAVYVSPSEEKRVEKQFDSLSEWVSKDTGETAFTMASKTQNIKTLFTETCGFKAPFYSLSGSYSPDEISGYAAQARLRFSRLSLRFYDIEIDFPEDTSAKVMVTGRLKGESKAGERLDEIREVHCVMKKIENKWFFSEIEVIEVLKK